MNAPFHQTVFDYSPSDLGGLHDHLRDVPCEGISKLGAAASAAGEYWEWVLVA